MRPLHLLNQTSTLPSPARIQASHSQAIKSSLINDTYTANNLINNYIKCGQIENAVKLFDKMPHRDKVSWNTIITCYVNSRNFNTSWAVLKSMKNDGFVFDGYTFGSMFKAIALTGRAAYGEQLHSDLIKMGYAENVYAGSALLDMYAKCARVEDASKVFNHMTQKNEVSWNALIAGYAEMEDRDHCLWLMKCMEEEGIQVNDATLAPILTLLDDFKFYQLTRQIHGKVVKHGLEYDNTVLNATITAYSECGCIEDAKKVFDGADGYRDLVTWNSMLAAYIEHEREECGFKLFLEMEKIGLEPDIYTYTSVVSSCFGGSRWKKGKLLHGLVIKRGLDSSTPICNAFITMYLNSNNREIEDAMKVFECMEEKDLVSWNTILTGLSQNGSSENVLKLFEKMHRENLDVDHYTFSAILRTCSDMATLQLGQKVHVLVVKHGFEANEHVASALIFMYSKCGIIADAEKCFDVSCKDISVTWNSLIFAYAQHGQGGDALDLFHEMSNRHVKLDHITFVALVTACSHIGLVEEGLKFLRSMEPEYGVPPRMENYACAIDLLGRAGRLMEAKDLIKEMPFEPDAMVWKTLLGACRSCGDIDLATQVASHLLELEPGEHSTYILLSDLYGNLKRWDEKAGVKRLMRERGVKKVPGWSWIEFQNEVHAFNAEDHSHPNCQEIYQILSELMNMMKVFDSATYSKFHLCDLDLAHVYWVVDDTGFVQSVEF